MAEKPGVNEVRERDSRFDKYQFGPMMAEERRLEEQLYALEVAKNGRLVEALNALIGPARGSDGSAGAGRWDFSGCALRCDGDHLIVGNFAELQYGGDGHTGVGALLGKCKYVSDLVVQRAEQGRRLLSFKIPLALVNTARPDLAFKVMRDMEGVGKVDDGVAETRKEIQTFGGC